MIKLTLWLTLITSLSFAGGNEEREESPLRVRRKSNGMQVYWVLSQKEQTVSVFNGKKSEKQAMKWPLTEEELNERGFTLDGNKNITLAS